MIRVATIAVRMIVGLSFVALSSPHLQADPRKDPSVPYWYLVDSAEPLSLILRKSLQVGAKTEKYSLYGKYGMLNVIAKLNPWTGPKLLLKQGQIIMIPVPVDRQDTIPKNWVRATPENAQEWLLTECCTPVMHAKLNGVMRRKDSWPRLIAEVNGRLGEEKLRAKPGEWLLLPSAIEKNTYLPSLSEMPTKPLPPEISVATVVTKDSAVSAIEDKDADLVFFDASLAPPPDREKDFQAIIETSSSELDQKTMKPLSEAQQKVVAEPRKADLAAITDLPAEAIEEIEKADPEVLDAKLTPETIEKLDAEAVEKIPEKTKERKAWKYSFLDSMKPGAQKFFKSMDKSAAGIYVGTRVGFSLIAAEEKLLSQVQVFGLLTEVRSGWLRGVRLYWDYVPAVKAEIAGTNQTIGWNRVLLGYSFEFALPWQLRAHLAPQLGRYSLKAKIPPANATVTDPAIAPVAEEFSQAGAISGGLYADLERQAFFYILRIWASTDQAIPGASKANEQAITSRFGLDAFLKGSGFEMFGRSIAPSYLLFTSLDSFNLKGKTQNKDFDLQFFIPYMGLGISLSW